MKTRLIIEKNGQLVTAANIACRATESSRQEIVNLSIKNINKHKGTKAARKIASTVSKHFEIQ